MTAPQSPLARIPVVPCVDGLEMQTTKAIILKEAVGQLRAVGSRLAADARRVQ
jgi:hypothetical protein